VGGIIGGIIGQRVDNKSRKEMRETTEGYTQLPIDQILTNDKKNFAIPYDEIENIKVRKPGLLGRGEILIKTNSKKHQFNFMTSKELFTEYLHELEKVVPDCF
jgi:hypothetical protein